MNAKRWSDDGPQQRAIARGLKISDRTALITLSNRVFAISQKCAKCDGVASPARVSDAARLSAKWLGLVDFGALAEANSSVISAALFGGLAGAEALPFERDACEAAIGHAGKAVSASLKAFAEGFKTATQPLSLVSPIPIGPADHSSAPPPKLPKSTQALARIGVERLTIYQDGVYARLYIERLQAFAAADEALGGADLSFDLTREVARRLAVWMSYEDLIRVADLETGRVPRERVLGETRAATIQVLQTTEFMQPRFEELCDLMPARLWAWALNSLGVRRNLERLTGKGRLVTMTNVSGFVLLWAVARLRRWRRATLCFSHRKGRIEAWIESAVNAARTVCDVGVEMLWLQRLVKGCSDTYARGPRNFGKIMGALGRFADAQDAARTLRALYDAALAYDEGLSLAGALRWRENSGAGAPTRVELIA